MNIIWVLIVATSLNTGYELKNKFESLESCQRFISFANRPDVNQVCVQRRTLETDFIKE